MVARVAPEKRLSLGTSSKPIFFQLTEFPVTDRVLLLLKDGRLGASAIAETFRTFFDSLITRASLRLLPLLETLLFKRVDLDLFGV